MNPFLHLSQEEVAKLFGFGVRSMRALVAMDGFPIVAKKVNPDHFKMWLWENRRAIGKLTEAGK